MNSLKKFLAIGFFCVAGMFSTETLSFFRKRNSEKRVIRKIESHFRGLKEVAKSFFSCKKKVCEAKINYAVANFAYAQSPLNGLAGFCYAVDRLQKAEEGLKKESQKAEEALERVPEDFLNDLAKVFAKSEVPQEVSSQLSKEFSIGAKLFSHKRPTATKRFFMQVLVDCYKNGDADEKRKKDCDLGGYELSRFFGINFQSILERLEKDFEQEL